MAREVEARLLVFEGLIILLSVVESCAVVQVCGRVRRRKTQSFLCLSDCSPLHNGTVTR